MFTAWDECDGTASHIMRFSDKAHFHLDRVMNKQNVHFWDMEKSTFSVRKYTAHP
jgi:hypothetical protein